MGSRPQRRSPSYSTTKLFLRGEQVFKAAQCQGVTGDAEPGDDTKAHRCGLRRRSASYWVRDVDLDGWELNLRQGRDQRRIARAERRRVENRGVETLVVSGVYLVDDFALDVRVEDLDVEAELGSIATDAFVVFGQGHWAEDLELDLAAHIHAGAVDDQDFRHELSPVTDLPRS